MANEGFEGFEDFDDYSHVNEYPDFMRSAGDSIRDIINPALADTRKEKIQLNLLDKIFSSMADRIPDIVNENLSVLYDGVSFIEDEDMRNRAIIEKMTLAVRGGYSPIIKESLPITIDFANFSADEVRELPGYIKFHKAARTANVAVAVKFLLKDEEQGGPPPHIVIDASKTYEQGAIENSRMYPHLPDNDTPANDDAPAPKKAFNFDM